MFPSASLLTASQALYSDHTVRSGALVPTTSGSDTVVSPVLRAPSSSLSAALVKKMNVLWGLDVPFYIAHNTGLHLGNYARNDGNGSDGKAVQAFPRPTIDQIMAWSPSFYSEPVRHPRARDGHVGPAGVVELQRPGDDVQRDPERARLLELAGAVQQDLRAARWVDRAGATCADRRSCARQLQPPAQTQHAAVRGRQAAPRRSRRAHRRAAAQADDDVTGASVQCLDADRQRQQAQRQHARGRGQAAAALERGRGGGVHVRAPAGLACSRTATRRASCRTAATGTRRSRTSGSSPTSRRCWCSRTSASSRRCSSTWRGAWTASRRRRA